MKKWLGALVAVSAVGTGCGGGSEQSATCARYVTCVKAAAPNMAATTELIYGKDGSCWENDQTAEICEAGCTDGLTTLRMGNPEVSACN